LSRSGLNNFYPATGHKAGTTTEASVQTPMSQAVTAKNLSCQVSVAPGGAAQWTMTLRSAAADTTLKCTITAAATTCQDNTHTPSISKDALIDFNTVATITTPANLAKARCCWEADL
jgi:predicted alternative tryptophan synthase beta-subunit